MMTELRNAARRAHCGYRALQRLVEAQKLLRNDDAELDAHCERVLPGEGRRRRPGFKPPRTRGHTAVDPVQAMIDGRAKVFIGLGDNFVAAVPDRAIAEAAMRHIDWSAFEENDDLIRGRIEDVFPVLFRDPNRRIR
jgi:hypothetical protein